MANHQRGQRQGLCLCLGRFARHSRHRDHRPKGQGESYHCCQLEHWSGCLRFCNQKPVLTMPCCCALRILLQLHSKSNHFQNQCLSRACNDHPSPQGPKHHPKTMLVVWRRPSIRWRWCECRAMAWTCHFAPQGLVHFPRQGRGYTGQGYLRVDEALRLSNCFQ